MTSWKSGCAETQLVLFFKRQHAPRIGERMDHHRGVLAGLDDLVEITDRAIAHGERQRAVVPHRAFRREQETAGKIGSGHVLVCGDRNQRPLKPPRHVFDKSRLAGAGRALQHHRQPARIGCLEQRDLRPDRQVIRLGLDTVGFQLHGPFLRLAPRPPGMSNDTRSPAAVRRHCQIVRRDVVVAP